ncbi:hypothetical protein RMATCC62417_09182 [Rhizopus microsporus]|nr:hypothetical protein RMATCC62417_09182 [Rhizopus microsporus]
MTPKFWTHSYRKVIDDKDKRNERIKFSKNINDCFEEFDSTRKSTETKVLLGFLRGLRESTSQSFNPRAIDESISYSNLLATKAVKSIELYKEYKDANIELEGFESQYNKIFGIYKDVFNNDTFESISDYAYAKNNSARLVRFK